MMQENEGCVYDNQQMWIYTLLPIAGSMVKISIYFTFTINITTRQYIYIYIYY